MAFPFLLLVVGMVLLVVVIAMPKPSGNPAVDDQSWLLRMFKGVNDEGLARTWTLLGMAVASFLTGLVYRAVRWERVVSPHDGEGGQAKGNTPWPS